ncbi:type IX secretion system protein PorD [Mesoflavibacter profundi]|uniref:type IX secretion system protein PorD n=1 Tax=Mesoflavibacter profundi TaxID=2708110 RepID=UPI00243D5FB9
MRNFLFVLILLTQCISFAQEFNATVVVNAQLTGNENLQQFKTLENQLTEFITNTKWTNKEFKPQERINCNLVINITEYSGNNYNATLQIQSSRPVFGASYTTPIYNINDKDFSFDYVEFQNIIYNPNQYVSNLISVLSFHVYMILGMDADSFEENGGDVYFKQAQNINNFSQQNNYKGWKLEDGLQSRFALIDNLMSPTYKEFRQVMYSYHRKGLDQFSMNLKDAKNQIATSLLNFKEMNRRRPNSYLARIFFDAKAEEIEQIFSDGPSVEIVELVDVLNKVAPMHSSKWRNIKF